MDNLVSVVMSVYNEKKEWIQKSIESVLQQTWTSIEFIIIVDNPQNNEAIDTVREYAEQDNRIRYVVNDINRGLVYCLNRGMAMATGDILARMDADDISYANRIETEMKYLKKYKADFVIGCIDFLIKDEVQKGENTVFMEPEMVKELMKFGNVSFHPTWLMKKSVFEENGGYRSIKACEDVDFLLRSLQKEKKIIRLQEHVHLYRLQDQSISATNGLSQYRKAEFLRKEYGKKHQIDHISENKINDLGSNLSPNQIRQFQIGNRRMNDFCEALRFKKMGTALYILFVEIFRNPFYRQMFFRNVRYRIIYLYWVFRNTDNKGTDKR